MPTQPGSACAVCVGAKLGTVAGSNKGISIGAAGGAPAAPAAGAAEAVAGAAGAADPWSTCSAGPCSTGAVCDASKAIGSHAGTVGAARSGARLGVGTSAAGATSFLESVPKRASVARRTASRASSGGLDGSAVSAAPLWGATPSESVSAVTVLLGPAAGACPSTVRGSRCGESSIARAAALGDANSASFLGA